MSCSQDLRAFEERLEVEQDVQEINQLLVSEHEAEMFRAETENDEVFQVVKVIVQSGWPTGRRELSPTVAIYYDIRDELVIQDGTSTLQRRQARGL